MDKRKRHDLTKDLLHQEYVVDKLNLKQIAEKYNASPITIKRYLDKYGIPNGRQCIINSITKEEIEELYYNQNMSITEIARKYNTVYTGTLSQKMKDWGLEVRRDYRTKNQLKGQVEIKGNNLVCAGYIKRIKKRASRKGLEFDVDCDFISQLYQDQKGLCALSGMKIELPTENIQVQNHEYSATLDRIDSNLGYTKCNTQLLHKDINRMKYTHDTLYFIELCNNVIKFNKRE